MIFFYSLRRVNLPVGLIAPPSSNNVCCLVQVNSLESSENLIVGVNQYFILDYLNVHREIRFYLYSC